MFSDYIFSSYEEMKNNALEFITYKEYDNIRTSNTILNIIVPCILVFVLKINVFWFSISFILFDLLLSFISIIIISLSKSILNKEDNVKIRRIEYLKKANDKLEEEDDKIRNEYNKTDKMDYHTYKDIINYLRKSRERNNREIEILKESIKESEKERDEKIESSTTIEVYKEIKENHITEIESTIERISRYKAPKYLSDEISLEEVAEKTKKLKKLLKRKPEGIESACITINIYGNELINILYNLKDISENQREEFIPKIKEVIDEYNDHLDRLFDKIEKNDYTRMNVDINVLLNEIKKDKGV